jgi:4-hydroxybenzoate polyprenyltransferase
MKGQFSTAERIKDFYMLTLPYTHVLVMSVVLASVWIAKGAIFFDETVFLAIFLGMLWASFSNVLNNIHDLPSDKIHDYKRPLVKGSITISQAYMYYVALIALGFLISSFLNQIAVLITVFAVFLSIIYSVEPLKLKRWDTTTHLIMGLGYAVALFVLGWSLYNPIGTLPLGIALIFFLLTNVVTLGKDYKDVHEDLSVGIKTNAAWNMNFALNLHTFYIFLPYLLAIYMMYNGMLMPKTVNYFLVTLVLFLAAMFHTRRQGTPEGFMKSYVLFIISGVVAYLVFAISSVI